jgi:hypothetical protein
MHNSLQMVLLTTLAYCASFIATAWVVPIQRVIFPDQSDLASFVFLPHGVRVLAFFFFGWWAAAYLLPGKAIMWLVAVFVLGQSTMSGWGSIVSLASCLAAYEMARLFFKRRSCGRPKFSWQMILSTGLIASLLNAVGLTLLQALQPSWSIVAAYVIGDMIGLCALLLALMAYFRWWDRQRN